MNGDEIVERTLARVREIATGDDDPWLHGFAMGKISIAVVYLGADWTKTAAAQQEIERLTRPARNPRFAMTYCSQCGQETGPGDHGFSFCSDHIQTGDERLTRPIRSE